MSNKEQLQTNNTKYTSLIQALRNKAVSGEDGVLKSLIEGTTTDFVIPNGITTIRQGMFEDFESLTNVTIPKSVVTIENNAFSKCKNLTKVIFEEGNQITKIGNFAFYYCTNLISITIPSSILKLEVYALQIGSSTNKATIRFKGTTPPTLSSSVFDTSILQEIQVPMSAVDTYKSATNWSEFADYIVGY